MKILRRGSLLREYGEVGQNFRKLTDIRFRVLGFLPLVSGASVAVLQSSDKLGGARALGLALFGLAATLGLITYNVRNDQLYDELVGRAAHIERLLGLHDGQFAGRPRAWLTLHFGRLRWAVNHRSAIYLIYASAVALWLSLALAVCFELARFLFVRHFEPLFTTADPGVWVNVLAIVTAVIIVAGSWRLISKQRKAKSASLRTSAAEAYTRAVTLGLHAALQDPDFLRTCADLAGDTCPQMHQTLARAQYTLGSIGRGSTESWSPGSREYDAAVLVAMLTDMPSRWIFDVGEDRRGTLDAAEGGRSDQVRR